MATFYFVQLPDGSTLDGFASFKSAEAALYAHAHKVAAGDEDAFFSLVAASKVQEGKV